MRMYRCLVVVGTSTHPLTLRTKHVGSPIRTTIQKALRKSLSMMFIWILDPHVGRKVYLPDGSHYSISGTLTKVMRSYKRGDMRLNVCHDIFLRDCLFWIKMLASERLRLHPNPTLREKNSTAMTPWFKVKWHEYFSREVLPEVLRAVALSGMKKKRRKKETIRVADADIHIADEDENEHKDMEADLFNEDGLLVMPID